MTLIQVKVIEDIDLKFGTHIHQTMLCNIYSVLYFDLEGYFLRKQQKMLIFFEMF